MKQYKNRRWLKKQYIKNELSARDIGKMVGCATSTITRWLRRHTIPMRSRSEALKLAVGKPGAQARKVKSLEIAYERGDYDKLFRGKNLTEYEKVFALALAKANIPFRCQIRPKGCRYYYDFYIPSLTMFVDVSGHWAHYTPKGMIRDARKAKWAGDRGYTSVVIQNKEIKQYGAEEIIAKKIVQ